MSELAPPLDAATRRALRLDVVRAREEQIAVLRLQQRLELDALSREDLGGLTRRYVGDEVGLLLGLSPRQGRNRVEAAQMFAAFPAVHGLVADGTWLLEHADAALEELVGLDLTRDQQDQVLALVLARCARRTTPWQLRAAVRTAALVLFPDLVAEQAAKAHNDRDVRSYPDGPGGASLMAFGPASRVAEMMACLDTMSAAPAGPEDDRTLAQRRFDTLHALVCGRVQPEQWQAQVLVALSTLNGEDELPGEIVGLGPVPAEQAREIVAAGAALRRVVVDDATGVLVAVDSRVHRPDQRPPLAPARVPAAPTHDPADEAVLEPDAPDADVPDPDDLAWVEANTDRAAVYAERTAPASSSRTCSQPATPPATVAGGWSAAGLGQALHRIATDPVRYLDLSTESYAVPRRLKRHLELRDRTCVWPGCTRLARRCHKDHLIPWPRGSTEEVNLADECEYHHQGKHDCFRVVRLADGTFRWTTPCGQTYDRPPRPVLDAWTFRPRPT